MKLKIVRKIVFLALFFSSVLASPDSALARIGDPCDGGNGVCKDINARGYSCGGTVTMDSCGGANNIMCCTYRGKQCDISPTTEGECLNRRTSSCDNGTWKTGGLCPSLNIPNSLPSGQPDIQCCSRTFNIPSEEPTPTLPGTPPPTYDPTPPPTPRPRGPIIPENTGLAGDDGQDIRGVLNNLLLWLLGIVGILAVAAFVISGIQYLLSSGNEDMAESAKRNMRYALIGVVVAMGSLIIVRAIDSALRMQEFF